MSNGHDKQWDGIIIGASLATLDGDSGYGGIPDGALAWRGTAGGAWSLEAGIEDGRSRQAWTLDAEGGYHRDPAWDKPGAFSAHGLRTSSTQSSMIPSLNHAFSLTR